jgi:hypothetical protein
MPSSIPRPADDEFAPYYTPYIAALPAGDVLTTLEHDLADTLTLFHATPEARGTFRYAPGKWSVKDVVNHIIDAERIFAYRALRIARGDQTPLATFAENAYAVSANADDRTIADLAAELEAVRHATLMLFRSFRVDVMTIRGTASGFPVTPRALAHILAGHARHHVNVLRERYGLGAIS